AEQLARAGEADAQTDLKADGRGDARGWSGARPGDGGVEQILKPDPVGLEARRVEVGQVVTGDVEERLTGVQSRVARGDRFDHERNPPGVVTTPSPSCRPS